MPPQVYLGVNADLVSKLVFLGVIITDEKKVHVPMNNISLKSPWKTLKGLIIFPKINKQLNEWMNESRKKQQINKHKEREVQRNKRKKKDRHESRMTMCKRKGTR